MNKLTLKSIDYHRNGISGIGFYVAIATEVEDGETRKMVIIRFTEIDADCGGVVCAALDINLLAQGNIQFGQNSWRGDHYHEWMDQQIAALDIAARATKPQQQEKTE